VRGFPLRRRLHLGRVADGSRSRTGTLTSRWGSFSIAWRSARSPEPSASSVSSAAAIPSPDGHEAHVDDVPGLLAAECHRARAAPRARSGRPTAVVATSIPASRIAVWKP
jgi:hypothetical protein